MRRRIAKGENMKRIKAAILGSITLAMAFCTFACSGPEEEESPMEPEPVTLEAGTTPIAVEHHERTVYGDAYIPEAKRFPIVIFSHGFNGYKDDFKGIAEDFAEEGIASITFTFCGSGARDPSGFGTTNMTLYTEREDLSALVDYAKRIEGFNGKLYLFGGSQGGMVSALTAEERGDDLSGMILLYPAFGIRDDWSGMFPQTTYPTDESLPETVPNFNNWGVDLGRNFIITARTVDVFAKMPSFTKPVLIFHGDNDAVVNIKYSKQATGEGGYPNSKLIEYANFVHGAQPSSSDITSKLVPLVKVGKLPTD